MPTRKLALGLVALTLLAGGVAAWQLASERPDAAGNGSDLADRAIDVRTDKDRLAPGESVAFEVINAGRLAIEGTPDIQFKNARGEVVGAMMVAQVVSELQPGDSLKFTWDTDAGLPAGLYHILVKFGDLEAGASVLLG